MTKLTSDEKVRSLRARIIEFRKLGLNMEADELQEQLNELVAKEEELL
jgi:hypothetical protein